MNSYFWIIFAFLCGSLPFSVWVGKYYLKTDIRTVGDANPGATNVYRAGGRTVAALALFLDFIKGALPIGLAYLWAGLSNPHLVWVSLAPVAGHAFSPFLGGRGGKAVAVTFGIWAGLTGWEGPTVAGVFMLAGVALFGANGWAVLTTTVGLAAYMLLTPASWNAVIPRPEPITLLAVSIGTTTILGWKHRADFAHPPSLPRGVVRWR